MNDITNIGECEMDQLIDNESINEFESDLMLESRLRKLQKINVELNKRYDLMKHECNVYKKNLNEYETLSNICYSVACFVVLSIPIVGMTYTFIYKMKTLDSMPEC